METKVHPYDVEVGRLLRQLRLAYRVKQQELAARLGVDTATISRYERGERAMNVHLLLTIADLFQIPGSRLLPAPHQVDNGEPKSAVGESHDAAQWPVSDLPELEARAVKSIINVLITRPELIVGVMDYIERQDAPDQV